MTLKSTHFEMHYYQGGEPLAREFLAIAEEAYGELATMFGFEPRGRSQLVLLDDTDSANGLTYVLPYNKIVLYAPIPDPAGELGYWGDWKRILVYHELTHLFHMDRVKGVLRVVNSILGKTYLPNAAVPTWLLEGMAVLMESRIGSGGRIGNPKSNALLRVAVDEGKLLSLDEVSGRVLSPPRWSVPYLYGGQFLAWLAEKYGVDRLVAFVREQAGKLSPYSLNITARRLLGRTFVELYEDWRRQTRELFAAELAEIRRQGVVEGRKLAFAGEGFPAPSFSPSGSLLWTHSSGHETGHVREMAPDGSVVKLFTCRGGCDRPQRGPDGSILYGAMQYMKNYYYYEDIFRWRQPGKKGRRGRKERLTFGLRAKDPALAGDGGKVAWVRAELGTSALFVRDLATGQDREVLSSGGALSWPAWSPDGRRLVAVRSERGNSDLVLIDLESRALTELTPGPSVELNPVFTPDGEWVIFSSSRTGVFNLYAMHLESRCARRLTNVVGAALAPTVHPGGGKVVFASLRYGGYTLQEIPFEEACGQVRFDAAPAHPAAYSPPVPDLDAVSRLTPRRYAPFKHLRPRAWTPNFVVDSWDQLVLSAVTTGNDPANLLTYSVGFALDPRARIGNVTGAFTLNVIYPTVTVFGGYYRNRLKARMNDTLQDYEEDDLFASLAFDFPFYHPDYTMQVSCGYVFEHFDGKVVGDWQYDPASRIPYVPAQGNLSNLYVGFAFDNTESFSYSVGKERGVAFGLEGILATPILGSDWTEYRLTWRVTKFTRLPWALHHVLTTHYRGGIAGGDDRFMHRFGLGGYPAQDLLNSLLKGQGITGFYLRGYPPLAQRGRQYHYASVDYTLPLWRIRRGWQTLPIFLEDLYLDLFANAGGAFEEFDFEKLLWAAGLELKLSTLMGYSKELVLTLGAAYGFQEPGGFSVYFMLGQ
jgi:hypothetical protein